MILIPKEHYNELKNLIQNFSVTIQRVSSVIDRSSIKFMLQKWKQSISNLQKLTQSFSSQFQQAKITKKSYQLQIESLQQTIKNIRIQKQQKEINLKNYSVELMKVLQQNQKIKQVYKKAKEENKKLKNQISQISSKVTNTLQKYKLSYQRKIDELKAKIRYLEKNGYEDNQDELDYQIEQLAKLQAQQQARKSQ